MTIILVAILAFLVGVYAGIVLDAWVVETLSGEGTHVE